MMSPNIKFNIIVKGMSRTILMIRQLTQEYNYVHKYSVSQYRLSVASLYYNNTNDDDDDDDDDDDNVNYFKRLAFLIRVRV